jgi:parvulin-like peptidyl-prolyl isomerase
VKKDAVVALVAVLLVVAASYLLASVRPDGPNTPSAPFKAETKAGKRTLGPNDKVVMHVNGEPVTEAEFDSFILAAPQEQRAFYASPQGKRALADELVKLKTLEQEGRRLGIDDDPDVRAQVASVSSQIVAGRALEKLVRDGMDARVQAEFAKEKATAKTLRHILVAYEGSAVPAKSGQAPKVEQAMQKAAALVGRIRGGADFAQVAMQESDDQQTAPRGGVLGAARPEQLPPDIAAVVTKLQPGQVSDPLRTEFGVHIFKVEAPSMEEMRPMLEQRIQREVMEETVGRLQKGAKVELEPSYFGPEPKPLPAAPGLPKSNG